MKRDSAVGQRAAAVAAAAAAFVGDARIGDINTVRSDGQGGAPLPAEFAELEAALEGTMAKLEFENSPVELIAMEDQQQVLMAFVACHSTGEPAETSARLVTGQLVDLCMWNLLDEHEIVISVVRPARGAAVDHQGTTTELVPRRLVHRLTVEGKILWFDEATTILLGWDDTWLGQRRLPFVHPDDHAIAIENFIFMMSNPDDRSQQRFRLADAWGDYRWFDVVASNQIESHGWVELEMFDVTEEQQLVAELAERQKLLVQLTEALPSAIVHMTEDRRVIHANAHARNIFNVSQGDTLEAMVGISDHDQEALRAALALDIAVEETLYVNREDSGGQRRERIRIRPVDAADTAAGRLVAVVDVTAQWELQRALEERTRTDPLTGAANRAGLDLWLDQNAVGKHERWTDAGGFAAIYVDLDDFKGINDTWGHGVGDEILVETARLLRLCSRPEDVVVRLGGDEFVLVGSAVLNEHAAQVMADRVAKTFETAGNIFETEASWSASIGVAFGKVADEDLIARADASMYANKPTRQTGRHQR